MGLIAWRVQTVAVDLLDLSSSTLLSLSMVLHNDQVCSVRGDSAKTGDGTVSECSQPIQSEVQLQSDSEKPPALSTPIVRASTSDFAREAKDALSPSTTTSIHPETPDSPCTQRSDSGLRHPHEQRSRECPPDLKALYKKTKENVKVMHLAKKKMKLQSSSDPTRSRARLRPASTQPEKECQQMNLPTPSSPYDKAKTCLGAVGNGAESVACSKQSVQMNKDQTPASAQALWLANMFSEQASHFSKGTETPGTISIVGPSTVASDNPETDTESSVICYQHHIKALQECRKALNARRQERSQAQATCHKADLTLQYITRNGIRASKFWRKYQQASRAVFDKTVRDLRKARALETRLVMAVEEHERALEFRGKKEELVKWRQPVGRDRWIEYFPGLPNTNDSQRAANIAKSGLCNIPSTPTLGSK